MTYSKEQYDIDLARYQAKLEAMKTTINDGDTFHLLLKITKLRLDNFNSYSQPRQVVETGGVWHYAHTLDVSN